MRLQMVSQRGPCELRFLFGLAPLRFGCTVETRDTRQSGRKMRGGGRKDLETRVRTAAQRTLVLLLSCVISLSPSVSLYICELIPTKAPSETMDMKTSKREKAGERV